MDKRFSIIPPEKVERSLGRRVINYDMREATEEEILREWQNSGRAEMEGDEPTEDFKVMNKYVYNRIEVAMGQWSYDGIINAIIRDKYRIDEMEAITNNMAAVNAVFMQTLVTEGILEATRYLKESIDDDNTARFKEMQEWRALAKSVASEVIAYAKEQSMLVES